MSFGQNPWECPRCRRINAHWVSYCDCKPAVDQPARQQPFAGMAGGTYSTCLICGKDIFNGTHECLGRMVLKLVAT